MDLAGYNPTVASLSGAVGTITNNGAADAKLSVGQSGQATFSGILQDGASNRLSLDLTGSGTLLLAGSNTFSGTVHTANGTIVVANPAALQNATATDGNDNGIAFGSGITAATLGGLRGTELLTLTNADGNGVNLSVGNNGSNTTFTGTIGGSGGLTKIGGGMFTLTGANSYANGTTVSAGILQVGSSSALGGGGLTANGGTLDLNGNALGLGSLSGVSGTITSLAGSSAAILVNQVAATTFSGTIQDGPSSQINLAMGGNGTLTLTNPNAYSGGTVLNNGALVLANVSGSALGSGTLTLNGGILAAGPAGGSIGGLVQAGSAAHSLAPGAGLSAGSGTLNLNGGLSTNANTTLAFNVTDAIQISGGIYVGDLINLNGSSLTVSGGSIAFVGASPTTLGDYRLIANLGSTTNPTGFSLPAAPSGSNETYQLSTTVDAGNLDLVVASAAIFSGSATWTSNGSNPVWSNSGNWSDNVSHLPSVPGTSLSRTGDTATFSGSGSTSITLDVSPSLAALSFSGTNYTLSGSGTLTMNGGTAGSTITVAGGTQTIASAVQIADGNLVVAASGNGLLVLSGSVADDGGRSLTLTGDGSGQLLLGGANSYGGGTYVEQGTVIANDNGAVPDGSGLIVGAGGTFIFDPTVTGVALDATSLHAASQINPVPEPGTLALLAAAGMGAAAVAWRKRRN